MCTPKFYQKRYRMKNFHQIFKWLPCENSPSSTEKSSSLHQSSNQRQSIPNHARQRQKKRHPRQSRITTLPTPISPSLSFGKKKTVNRIEKGKKKSASSAQRRSPRLARSISHRDEVRDFSRDNIRARSRKDIYTLLTRAAPRGKMGELAVLYKEAETPPRARADKHRQREWYAGDVSRARYGGGSFRSRGYYRPLSWDPREISRSGGIWLLGWEGIRALENWVSTFFKPWVIH